MPWLFQCLSFVLKSPITTRKSGSFSHNFSNSKFCEINKKSFWVELEIYKEEQSSKVYYLFRARNLCIHVKDLHGKLLKEENFCNKYKHLRTWYRWNTRIKISFREANYVKFVNCDICLLKFQLSKVMSRYTVKAPMADWKSFILFTIRSQVYINVTAMGY